MCPRRKVRGNKPVISQTPVARSVAPGAQWAPPGCIGGNKSERGTAKETRTRDKHQETTPPSVSLLSDDACWSADKRRRRNDFSTRRRYSRRSSAGLRVAIAGSFGAHAKPPHAGRKRGPTSDSTRTEASFSPQKAFHNVYATSRHEYNDYRQAHGPTR